MTGSHDAADTVGGLRTYLGTQKTAHGVGETEHPTAAARVPESTNTTHQQYEL